SFEAGSTVNICIEQIRYYRNGRRMPITSSCNSVSAAVHRYAHGIPIEDFVASGHLELESDSTISLGQASTMTEGLVMHAQQAVLREVWPLVNVTGNGMTISEWDYRIPTVGGAV